MLKIDLLGEPVILMTQKCLYLEAFKTLLLADLHFGKINHFRKSGIPIPTKGNNRNAELLIESIQQSKAERVLFLGDLFHSHYNQEWEVIGQIRKHFVSCSFELILGNHDIMSRLQYKRHAITVHESQLAIGNFLLTHEPLTEVPMHLYNLSGHIHPGVRLVGAGKQALMLPCFYFGKRGGLLPAFGSFTGLARITPKKSDKVFVIAEGKIMEMK